MAMSGGIDSSVAAILLMEQGYELVGATFRTFDSISTACMEREKGCCNVDSIFEAKQMAKNLGFEHHVLDLRQEFKETVIANFIDEYLHGRTPNPCVICNSVIKWGRMIEVANQLNCDYIATGHYARISFENSRYFLKKGIDTRKDQTYFLWSLTQENLARTLFPLGSLTKTEVRKIAAEHGYDKLSHKSESQEICFVTNNDYRSFLVDNVPNYAENYPQGDYVDTSGKPLGKHKGFPNYTIGQRKGLGIALGEPMFVVAIKPDTNQVVLGKKAELQADFLTATKINLMKYGNLPNNLEATVRIRYRNNGIPATIVEDNGKLLISFLSPADSITPGQSVVIYENDDVVGGGIIE
jgi:tRNA-specific 2-thiouridylase